jgi:hypothetical protein
MLVAGAAAGTGGAATKRAAGSCAQPATAKMQANKNSKERLTRIRHPARFIERKPINARYG